MERLVQPVPARIAGEHAAGPVRAMRRRGQADDQERRAGIAESGDRPAPVGPVAELTFSGAGDLAAVLAEAGTLGALDDLVVERGETGAGGSRRERAGGKMLR